MGRLPEPEPRRGLAPNDPVRKLISEMPQDELREFRRMIRHLRDNADTVQKAIEKGIPIVNPEANPLLHRQEER